MQSFFNAIANMASEMWEIFKNIIDYFLGLIEALWQYVTFVKNMLSALPSIVMVPASIILTIMIIKFFLNMGKN